MWALGIIIYKLVSQGKHPFYKTNYFIKTILSIRDGDPEPLPSNVSPFLRDIIFRLLDKNPETRPDAKTLLNLDPIKNYVKKIVDKVTSFDREMG